MLVLRKGYRTACALLLLVVAATVIAQDKGQKPFEPYSGQPGKDVVWVPTPQSLVDKMLNLAKVTANDYVMDLGSGDGRTVITAAKRGARAVGIEYNPDMVELSNRNAAKEGLSGKVTFMKADLFETDLSQATVITMFLLPEINIRLRPKLLNLKPGTRIVSNTFTMGEWLSDESVSADEKEGCNYYCRAMLWIVPAKVEGTWQMPQQGELSLHQDFQMVSGTLKMGGKSVSFTNGRLRGDEITFRVGNTNYVGKVNGNNMEGTITGGGSGTWSASRVGKS